MRRAIGFVAVFLVLLTSGAAWAQWLYNGVALCTAPGDQQRPTIVSDGFGGAITTWMDSRSGNLDIYAQRVDGFGRPLWTAGGVAVCTATGNQVFPTITSDGAGGAIVTWYDARNGAYDIYAQRVNATGAVQWTANGVALCTATVNQYWPNITCDGAGGAIVTWEDTRSGNYDIYAQRVNASGAVQWTTDGVAICTATGGQGNPTIVSDGAGGAIITWWDPRSGNWNIYAQRVSASGAVQWTADGVPLSTAPGNKYLPAITSDGSSGAIVTWQGQGTGSVDIYAQRVNASGAVQWTVNGVALCTATGDQQSAQITSDGAGGAIVTWSDGRTSSIFPDIYAQRVSPAGAVQWTADGVPLCTARADQLAPQITSDGAGGAIVTWYDGRSGVYYAIYAQRVNGSGTIQWATDGMDVCTAPGEQFYPMIATDGAGGAIVTWQGQLTGDVDIYAQRIERNGYWGYPAPFIVDARDVPHDQGGVIDLAWDASRLDSWATYGEISSYTVWRGIKHPSAEQLAEDGAVLVEDVSKIDLKATGPVIRVEKVGAQTYYWKLMFTLDAYELDHYSKAVPTLFDSTSVCREYHYFQVIAHSLGEYWISPPDSGRSVDNLTPDPPTGLQGEQRSSPSGLTLTWKPSGETDLGNYAVYRSTSPDFTPGPGSLIATPTEPSYLDDGWIWSAGYCYKVSAIDIHGNQSGFALLNSDDITGTETPKAPKNTYLSQNFPNPFNPMTRIEFGLKEPANVSLRIYDAAGRLVRVLAGGKLIAGKYVNVWDGRDGKGEALASGMYFYRLDAGSFEQTKKMVLLR